MILEEVPRGKPVLDVSVIATLTMSFAFASFIAAPDICRFLRSSSSVFKVAVVTFLCFYPLWCLVAFVFESMSPTHRILTLFVGTWTTSQIHYYSSGIPVSRIVNRSARLGLIAGVFVVVFLLISGLNFSAVTLLEIITVYMLPLGGVIAGCCLTRRKGSKPILSLIALLAGAAGIGAASLMGVPMPSVVGASTGFVMVVLLRMTQRISRLPESV